MTSSVQLFQLFNLMHLFKLSSEVRINSLESLNSIDKKLLYIPKFKTVTYGKNSLRYYGPTLWNKTFKTGVIRVRYQKLDQHIISKML